MSRRRYRVLAVACLGTVSAGCSGRLDAQAIPTATGPGSYITAGATASGYDQPYGQQHNLGFAVFADANLTRHIGAEAEARFLRFHTDEQTRSSAYLLGPRISLDHKHFHPYAKVLFGYGRFTFPFQDAQGGYFVTAPGTGLDVSVIRDRVSVRVIDFEYQNWSNFTFGAAHPYGLSTGLSFRIR